MTMQWAPGTDHGPEPARGQRNHHAPQGESAGQHSASIDHRQGINLVLGTPLHIKAVNRPPPNGSQLMRNALHPAISRGPFAQELVGGVNQGLVGNAIQGWRV